MEHRVLIEELPLDARTDERGRPYTLVLTNGATLFDDARHEMDVLHEPLARLDELDRG